jgi:hypothetical protein
LPTPEGAKDEPVEHRKLVLAEATKTFRRLEKSLVELREYIFAACGEGDRLDATVVPCATSGDEPAALQAIDDSGNVRGVAGQRVGDARHRTGGTVLEEP